MISIRGLTKVVERAGKAKIKAGQEPTPVQKKVLKKSKGKKK